MLRFSCLMILLICDPIYPSLLGVSCLCRESRCRVLVRLFVVVCCSERCWLLQQCCRVWHLQRCFQKSRFIDMILLGSSVWCARYSSIFCLLHLMLLGLSILFV